MAPGWYCSAGPGGTDPLVASALYRDAPIKRWLRPRRRWRLASHWNLRVAFMTSHDASVLLNGESVGVPNDAQVCYIELRGHITFLMVAPGATPLTFEHGFELFDAQIGNLLMGDGVA